MTIDLSITNCCEYWISYYHWHTHPKTRELNLWHHWCSYNWKLWAAPMGLMICKLNAEIAKGSAVESEVPRHSEEKSIIVICFWIHNVLRNLSHRNKVYTYPDVLTMSRSLCQLFERLMSCDKSWSSTGGFSGISLGWGQGSAQKDILKKDLSGKIPAVEKPNSRSLSCSHTGSHLTWQKQDRETNLRDYKRK